MKRVLRLFKSRHEVERYLSRLKEIDEEQGMTPDGLKTIINNAEGTVSFGVPGEQTQRKEWLHVVGQDRKHLVGRTFDVIEEPQPFVSDNYRRGLMSWLLVEGGCWTIEGKIFHTKSAPDWKEFVVPLCIDTAYLNAAMDEAKAAVEAFVEAQERLRRAFDDVGAVMESLKVTVGDGD